MHKYYACFSLFPQTDIAMTVNGRALRRVNGLSF